MDLATHFRVIAQNWLRILVISLVLAAVVFLASSFRSDVYQATETLSIRAGADRRADRAGGGHLRRPGVREVRRDGELPHRGGA